MDGLTQELTEAGVEVTAVAINLVGQEATQALLAAECSFPLFQDVEGVGAWELHAGQQEDVFVYGRDGRLAAFFGVFGPDGLELSDEDDRARLRAAVEAAAQ